MAENITEKRPAPYDVEALLDGDHRAFEQLVRAETPRLFRVIVRMVKDEDEARSLVQETFLQAYKSLGRFRGDSALSTWLTGIGLNLARSHLRKHGRTDVMAEDDVEQRQPRFQQGRYVETPRNWEPHERLERRERQQIVHEAIEQLPENYREVVILRDIEQLSTDEAAEVLGITPGNVRVRLHRARQALHDILNEHFEEVAE